MWFFSKMTQNDLCGQVKAFLKVKNVKFDDCKMKISGK